MIKMVPFNKTSTLICSNIPRSELISLIQRQISRERRLEAASQRRREALRRAREEEQRRREEEEVSDPQRREIQIRFSRDHLW